MSIITTFQELADKLGLPFLEASAKNNTNVEQAFMTMASTLKSRFPNGPEEPGLPPTTTIGKTSPVKKDRICC